MLRSIVVLLVVVAALMIAFGYMTRDQDRTSGAVTPDATKSAIDDSSPVVLVPPRAEASGARPEASPSVARTEQAPVEQLEESEPAFELRVLQSTLAEFLGEKVDDPQWPGMTKEQLSHPLVSMSVAAFMDSAGRGQVQQDGQKVQHPGEDYHALSHNGKDYFFRQGEFPAYDQWSDFKKTCYHFQHAKQDGQEAPKLSPELVASIAQFARDAIIVKKSMVK